MTTKAERRTAAAQRSVPALRTISDRDVTLLGQLRDAANASRGAGSWRTVRELGGGFHTWHAGALSKLARHALVERKWFDTDRGRVLRAHITTAGRRVLNAVERVE